MQLPIPFLSAIETAINAWLKLDDDALPKFAELEGKIICMKFTGLDLSLFFFPSASCIQVHGNYPSEEDGGVVDATITGSPLDLMRLSSSSNSGATLLDGDIEITGDIRVAEKFSAILREVDIDWEEHLSRLFGNFFAHEASKTSQNVGDWFNNNIQALKNNTKEYLVDESKLSPDSKEMNDFLDQVDDIRSDVDRLEARIKLLQQELKNK